MTLVQAYDGTEGWKISPFQGRKDPEKMSADEAKSLIEDAEVDGPLVDWKAKGSTVEYLGPEDVDGTLAHKLKVVRKNGDVSYVYLDPDYFLEIRILTQRIEQGAQVEVETDLGDYEKVDGVFFPFSIDAGPKGSTDKQKIIIEKAEANVPVDDADLQISRDHFQIIFMRFLESHSFHSRSAWPAQPSAPSKRPTILRPSPVSARATSAPRP